MTSVVGFHKDKQKELSLAIETNQVKKRFNAFSEKYKYTQDIRILYQILDDPMLTSGSNWRYTDEEVNPHKKAIVQKNVVSCKDDLNNPSSSCTATQLQVRYKVFFDFKVKMSFKALDIGGWIGIIFRKKDDFNYYSLDISEKWVRLRKMFNG